MRFEYQGKKETLESLGYKVVVEQETNEDYPIPEPELGRILYSKYADRVLGHEAVNFDKFDIDKYEYLNVYAYLKGGTMMSIDRSKYPFTCRWDAGQCGYVAATKQEIREYFGVKRVTQKVLEKTYDTFRNMVQAFDNYYNKPVYYVSIEKDGEIIDGVGWVQGDEGVESFMRETLVGIIRDKVLAIRNKRVNPFMMPLKRKRLNKFHDAFQVNDVNEIKFYQMSDDDITMMINILNSIKTKTQ